MPKQGRKKGNVLFQIETNKVKNECVICVCVLYEILFGGMHPIVRKEIKKHNNNRNAALLFAIGSVLFFFKDLFKSTVLSIGPFLKQMA